MDKQLFFTVWCLPELRQLIKSFMYPGKKMANYYNYRNGDMASRHGYLQLIMEKSANLSFTAQAIIFAAKEGHLEIVIWLYNNRMECRVPEAISKAIRKAAKYGHIEIVKCLYNNTGNVFVSTAIDAASENGHLEIVKWLHNNGYTTMALGDALKMQWILRLVMAILTRLFGCITTGQRDVL